jgi:lipopolysaccharide transport system ATP-binding protein
MSDPVIHVVDLEKRYRVWAHARPTNVKERVRLIGATARARAGVGSSVGLRQEVQALRGVSFDVGAGEVLGVIGRNGAGKSTLLSILARITEPTGGFAELRGRVSSLLEVGTGFHPELSGRDNVRLNGAILGMSRAETARKFDEIVEFSGVQDFLDIPVKRYSSGMQVRLAFAVAAHLDPEILLLDEVLAVGDAEFQARCHARVTEITRSGRTVLFVSHDVNSVARLCKRTVLLKDGRVEFDGPSSDAIELYLGGRPQLIGGGYLGDAERTGTGELRFLAVQVTGAGALQEIIADQPVEFTLDFAAQAPISARHLQVRIDISSPGSGTLMTLSTRFDSGGGIGPDEIGHGSVVRCQVDELPLRPGRYLATLQVIRGAETLDRVADQVEIVVTPSDYFGTGALPTEADAPVLVRQHWQVEKSRQSSEVAS